MLDFSRREHLVLRTRVTQSCLWTHSDPLEEEKQLENGLGKSQAGMGWLEGVL